MTSMASALATPDYQEMCDGLARVIRKHRSDCDPYELARQLLEYDQPGHTTLVGINDEATRAILYHKRVRYALGVQIKRDGLADGDQRTDEFGAGLDEWIAETMESFWGWIHPRYR